jgi:CRP-like cAMP-binding protein
MSAQIASVLARLDLFRGLGEDECRRISELGRVEYWRNGALVLEEGAFGPRMMVLLQGEVEILRRDGNGVERAIGRVGAGEALGEMSLLLDLPRTASVRALSDLQVFAMDREAFLERVRASDPAALRLGFELSRTLARRLLSLNERVMTLLTENDEMRRRFGEARQDVFQLWDAAS